MIAADIVTGLLSSIIYDGARRPLKGIFHTIQRRRAVTKALSSEQAAASASHDLDEAVKDLSIAISNGSGLFDKSVVDLLKEIDRSALPDLMKQFALCGKSPESLLPTFLIISDRYPDLPIDGPTIFNALTTAINIRVTQSINDPGLFDALTAQGKNLSSKIESLSTSLSSITPGKRQINVTDYRDYRFRIAKGIENSNKTISIETTAGTKRVNVNKLVIAARLSVINGHNNIPNPHSDSEHQISGETIGYIPFRRQFNRAVIMGDPGGGKSTLTQFMCHTLANQIVLDETHPNNKSFHPSDYKIPMRVILRSFESKQKRSPSYSLFDYLLDDVRSLLDGDSDEARLFLTECMRTGGAVLLFDGLDEILDINSRRNMVYCIEQFADNYSLCPCLITSRIVGYSDAPMSDEFELFQLARFNQDEVAKYSLQLIKAVTALGKVDAEAKAQTFIRQTDTVADDLRRNPLLLGLMVYIFVIRGDVPNNRPEIYKECSLLMFEKWDQNRDIKFEYPDDFDLLDLFGFLARAIFGKPETEDGVGEDWLLTEIRRFFEIWYEDKARSLAAAKNLVTFITGRAWVMCEVGPGVFKFTHRTFLEYFFARRLEEESGSPIALIQVIFEKAIRAEWDVVTHLALQIATFRSGPKSIQAMQIMLDLATGERFSPKEEINFLSFVGRTLDYLTLPEQKVKEVAAHIFAQAVRIGSSSTLEALELIHELVLSTKKRESLVLSEVERLAAPIVAGESSNSRTFVMYLLATRYGGMRMFRGRFDSERSEMVWRNLGELRSKTKRDQLERANISVEEASIYLFAYGDHLLDLYDKFRHRLLFGHYSDLVPFQIKSLPLRLLSSSLSANGSAYPLYQGDFADKAELNSLIERIVADLKDDQTARDALVAYFAGGESYFIDMIEEIAMQLASALERELRSDRRVTSLANCFCLYIHFISALSHIGESQRTRLRSRLRRLYSIISADHASKLVNKLSSLNYLDDFLVDNRKPLSRAHDELPWVLDLSRLLSERSVEAGTRKATERL